MFKSLYFEGFSRPVGGVRTIISILIKRLEEVGGEIRFKSPVNTILMNAKGEATGVDVGGEILNAPIVLSSIGYPETVRITPKLESMSSPRVGAMTFLESIFVFDKKIPQDQNSSTIVFYNNARNYAYRPATNFYDPSSAVVCFPDNYESQKTDGEGIVRVTYMANYSQWKDLSREQYDGKKDQVSEAAQKLIKTMVPRFDGKLLFKDIFSPLTIERYTWHLNGTVYGSVDKTRDGSTKVPGLFIIGTDQGFLGIVGSILSGISMANLHGLIGAKNEI